jgi:hypothetical protein
MRTKLDRLKLMENRFSLNSYHQCLAMAVSNEFSGDSPKYITDRLICSKSNTSDYMGTVHNIESNELFVSLDDGWKAFESDMEGSFGIYNVEKDIYYWFSMH